MSKDEETTQVEGDLVIEIEGDAVTETPVEGEKKKPEDVSEPGEGVEALKAQLAKAKENEANERARADRAEAARGTAATEARGAKQQTLQAHRTAATQAVESTATALSAAKAKYKVAMEEANYDAAAEAQAEISSAVLMQSQAQAYQGRVERAEKIAEQQQTETTQQQEGVDTTGLSARSRAWVERNASAFKDPRTDARIRAAHFAAVAEGIEQDSDDYFEKLEQAVAPKQQVREEPERKVNGDGSAISPSRGGGKGGSNPRVVRLTPEEVQTAKALEMTTEEYARDLIADPNSRLNRRQA